MNQGVFDAAMSAFTIESEAPIAARDAIAEPAFPRVVEALCAAERIAASRCGHSGIARMHFAHLMCCIDRPARFLPPSEAAHGGSGFMKQGDVLLPASRGGKTAELLPIPAIAKMKGTVVIVVTENLESPLANGSDIVLPMKVTRECDRYNCQGTTSFVVLSALFDALQASMIKHTGFQNEQFALTHPGGAVQTVKNYYSLDYKNRKQNNAELKQAVAQRAAELVGDGETLLINAGVTTQFIATALKSKRGLNIVTNSLAVAMELGKHTGFRVILLGGQLNVQYSCTYGSDALEQVRRYKADKAILSIDGVAVQEGMTTYHTEEAVIDRMMIERARHHRRRRRDQDRQGKLFLRVRPGTDTHAGHQCRRGRKHAVRTPRTGYRGRNGWRLAIGHVAHAELIHLSDDPRVIQLGDGDFG